MEARGGVHLRGLGLVVEKDEGPRLVFRYDPFPSRRAGKLFMALADADFAKLFCAKKSLRDALVELQLEDTLFVSCPTSEVAAAEDSATYWGDGDDDDGAIDGPSAEGSRRLKFFDVIWACTGAAPNQSEAGDASAALPPPVSLASLHTVVRDVAAALRHEERRCGYVSAQCAAMLALTSQGEGRKSAFDGLLEASPLARELKDALDGARGPQRRVRVRFNRWIAVCGRLTRPSHRGAGDGGVDHEATSSDGTRSDDDDGAASNDDRDLGDDAELHASDDDAPLAFAMDPLDDLAGAPRRNHGERFGAAPQARRLANTRRRRCYAPYETLLLHEDPSRMALPKSVTPQLRSLVHAADPTLTFHALADATGLPLPRVYRLARGGNHASANFPPSLGRVPLVSAGFSTSERLSEARTSFLLERAAHARRSDFESPRKSRPGLARHLVEWKRARVVAVVRGDGVYAVDDRAAFPPESATCWREEGETDDFALKHALAVLAAFGPARKLADALRDLETAGVSSPTERFLHLLTKGCLKELHTYVLRIDGKPPLGLEAAANAAAYRHKLEQPHSLPGAAGKLGLYDDVGADDDDDTREKQQQRLPKQAHDNAPHHLRLLHIFRALSPYFDGTHAIVEMMWRENLRHAEIDAALRAFSDLVVTVQR